MTNWRGTELQLMQVIDCVPDVCSIIVKCSEPLSYLVYAYFILVMPTKTVLINYNRLTLLKCKRVS